MLIRSLLFSAVILVLHSCGNRNENNNSSSTDSLKTDSIAAARLNTVPTPANFKMEELIGAWMAVEGDCYAEEINLDPEGSFSSYLHARPFSDGTWSLENNKLIIKLKDNSELRYTAKMDDSKMILTLTDETGKISIYEAIVGC